LDLAAPSKRLPSHQTGNPVCLSWDSSSCVPRRRHTVCTSTPRHCCQRRSAQSPPGDRVAVRLWFLTTSTVYSAQRPWVCCTPKPTGVHCVSPSAPHPKSTEVDLGGSVQSLHTMRFTPSEEFPSPAAVPRHRGRCPLAVRFAHRPSERRSTHST